MDYSKERYDALRCQEHEPPEEEQESYRCPNCGTAYFGTVRWVRGKIRNGQCVECREGSWPYIGISSCESCGNAFTPDLYSLGPKIDPRDYKRLTKFCKECREG